MTTHRGSQAVEYGICPNPSCGRSIQLRQNGRLRNHSMPQQSGDGSTPCPGGGSLPADPSIIEVDELANLIADTLARGGTTGAGGVALARTIVAAGYRRQRMTGTVGYVLPDPAHGDVV